MQLLTTIKYTKTYFVELDQSDEFEYESINHNNIKIEDSNTILLKLALIVLNGLINNKEIKYVDWIQISDMSLFLVLKSIFIVTNITISMR